MHDTNKLSPDPYEHITIACAREALEAAENIDYGDDRQAWQHVGALKNALKQLLALVEPKGTDASPRS